MFGIDGTIIVIIGVVIAAMLAATVSAFLPVFGGSRAASTAANVIGAVLVAAGTIGTLIYWDLSVSWLARIMLMNCVLIAVIIVLNFVAHYPDRADQMRYEALVKLKIN